jgi:hypothetical protein
MLIVPVIDGAVVFVGSWVLAVVWAATSTEVPTELVRETFAVTKEPESAAVSSYSLDDSPSISAHVPGRFGVTVLIAAEQRYH